jgi:hypothetical protein
MIIYPHHCNGRLHLPAMARSCRCLSVIPPPPVSSRNIFPSRTQRSRKWHATEANSLPSMLSSVATSTAAAIVSFSLSSSLTSTPKRRAKLPTCVGAIAAVIDHVIRLSFEHRPQWSNRRGSVPLMSMPYFSTSFAKNCKYVGFEPKEQCMYTRSCLPVKYPADAMALSRFLDALGAGQSI